MRKFCCEKAKNADIKLLDTKTSDKLSTFFKVFSDCSRIKILFALKEYELCVCDLSIIVSMEQSAVSHQLKTLKQYDIVSSRKQGKLTFYSLTDHHIFKILEDGLNHISH